MFVRLLVVIMPVVLTFMIRSFACLLVMCVFVVGALHRFLMMRMFVVMPAFFRHHAFQFLFRVGVYQIQQAHCPGTAFFRFGFVRILFIFCYLCIIRRISLTSDGRQDIFNPDIIFPSCVDKEVTVLNHADILRRGLIGMHFLAGFQKHMDIRTAPCYVSGKIIGRENRGDDLQAVRRGLLQIHRSSASRQSPDSQQSCQA